MKPILYILTLLLVACSTGKPKMIPEEQMKAIIKRSILVDAFLTVTDNRELANDETLSFFQPILSEYGYTKEDMQYSLGKYSQRKSDVLSALVESITTELKTELAKATRTIGITKKWDEQALKFTTDTLVYKDSTLKVTTLRDTTKLKFDIPLKGSGTYQINFSYIIDSLDKNQAYSLVFKYKGKGAPYTVIDRGMLNLIAKQTPFASNSQLVDTTQTKSLTVTIRGANNATRAPSLKIDSLRITYVPPIEEAQQRYFVQVTQIKPFKDIADELIQKDSLTLRAIIRPPFKK